MITITIMTTSIKMKMPTGKYQVNITILFNNLTLVQHVYNTASPINQTPLN